MNHSQMERIALYPGSFDPWTNGHLDILSRAVKMFDKIIVTVAVNNKKNAVFTGEERIELIRESIQDYDWSDQVEIIQFTGLLIDLARKKDVNVLLRGVRQISDFEYEFRMALANRRLAPEVDTVFLMPDEQLTFISATIVKEIAAWNGDLNSFVPDNVAKALREKYNS
ncbi:pantetheine-phosphate adenylyltransferase [Rhodohalobacter barkolensis]|nr:pantetheine-phosphate adenylyltransferase [Rhodohalobacter barkolensis]